MTPANRKSLSLLLPLVDAHLLQMPLRNEEDKQNAAELDKAAQILHEMCVVRVLIDALQVEEFVAVARGHGLSWKTIGTGDKGWEVDFGECVVFLPFSPDQKTHVEGSNRAAAYAALKEYGL